MDPELKKGFQELQAQVIESRSKIANIETCQKLTTHDAKINDSILEELSKDGNIEGKFLYQPVGRMLVKQEGEAAHNFLLERQKHYQERLKQYKEVKEVCLNRVKESENSLRELVNKKLNKNEQSTAEQDNKPAIQMTTSATKPEINDVASKKGEDNKN